MLDRCALRSVTRLAEQLHVALGAASALGARDDAIEFEPLARAASRRLICEVATYALLSGKPAFGENRVAEKSVSSSESPISRVENVGRDDESSGRCQTSDDKDAIGRSAFSHAGGVTYTSTARPIKTVLEGLSAEFLDGCIYKIVSVTVAAVGSSTSAGRGRVVLGDCREAVGTCNVVLARAAKLNTIAISVEAEGC